MKQLISLISLLVLTSPAFATSDWLIMTDIKQVIVTQSAENSEIHYDYRSEAAKKADETEQGYRVRVTAAKAQIQSGSGDAVDVNGGAETTVSFGFDPSDPLHQACLTTIANAKNARFGDTGAGLDCANVQ